MMGDEEPARHRIHSPMRFIVRSLSLAAALTLAGSEVNPFCPGKTWTTRSPAAVGLSRAKLDAPRAAVLPQASLPSGNGASPLTEDSSGSQPHLRDAVKVTPHTRLGVAETRFTINGKPAFLYGISYYGALGASDEFLRRDLDDIQRHCFNWIREWNRFGPCSRRQIPSRVESRRKESGSGPRAVVLPHFFIGRRPVEFYSLSVE
jgi:hypothetical protein